MKIHKILAAFAALSFIALGMPAAAQDANVVDTTLSPTKKIKLRDNGDGSYSPQASAAIDQTTPGTTNGVVVNSSVLPTGAATSANQTTMNTKLDTLHTDLTASLPAGTNVIGTVGTNAAQVTDVASAALTTTTTTATITPVHASGGSYQVVIPVTAVSGTNPTLDVVIQESDDGGTNWYDVYHFDRATATGTLRSRFLAFRGNRIRYVQTVGGTTPSFTRAILRQEKPFFSAPFGAQFFNRTIDPATLNSATPTYNVEGCKRFHLWVYTSVYAATYTVNLQGSVDGSAFNSMGSAVVSSAGFSNVVNDSMLPKYARAQITVAGAGNTLPYVALTCEQ